MAHEQHVLADWLYGRSRQGDERESLVIWIFVRLGVSPKSRSNGGGVL